MLSIENLLTGHSSRLPHIRRYASIPVHRTENVAEHSYYVVLYSLIIAKAIRIEDPTIEINYEKLATACAIHDIDESLSGDVLRHVKRYSPELKDMWNTMCLSFIQQASDSIGVDFVNEWKSDKDMTTIEGQILSLSDFLSVFSYGLEQYRLGNSHFHEILVGCYEYVMDHFGTDFDDKYCKPFSDILLQSLDFMYHTITNKK